MKTLSIKEMEIEVEIADGFWARLKGLLGTSSLAKDKALLISPCNSVHMIGMCYAIDVVYLDKEYIVIKIVENLKPWVGFSMCWRAEYVLEMAVGIAKENMYLGQTINIK